MRNKLIPILFIVMLIGCSTQKKSDLDVSDETVNYINSELSKTYASRVARGAILDTSEPLVAIQAKSPHTTAWPEKTVVAMVSYFVGKNGDVIGIRIDSTTDNNYNQTIFDALKQWKFKPPKLINDKDHAGAGFRFTFPTKNEYEAKQKAKKNQ